MAQDAGVLLSTAEIEHGARPTRSATVRRVTTFLSLFLSLSLSVSSNIFSPSILSVRASVIRSCTRSGGHSSGQDDEVRGAAGDCKPWHWRPAEGSGASPATLPKTHMHPEAKSGWSP